MEEIIVQILRERGKSITTMESCSGGFLINRITNVEGSSAVTNGAYVTYSNAQKIRMGVPDEVIQTHGVYSKETAIAMAQTAKSLMGANVAIGVTGTLSNVDPNNPDSQQGVVFFSIVIDDVVTFWEKFQVPILRRNLQKEFISDWIFDSLLTHFKELGWQEGMAE